MKVGDLVTLSAYGKKVKRAGWVRDGDAGPGVRVRGFGKRRNNVKKYTGMRVVFGNVR